MAGQDGYTEDQWAGDPLAEAGIGDGIDGRPHHLGSSKRVKVEDSDSHPRRFDAGHGDGVRNVVKFEIEKDLFSHRDQILNDRPAGCCEELFSDLEHPNRSTQAGGNCQCLGGGIDIERDDDRIANLTSCCHLCCIPLASMAIHPVSISPRSLVIYIP